MMRRLAFQFFALPALLICAVGCGSSEEGVALYPVTGKVTFGGTPIADGEIRFIAKDGARTDGGRITSGAYTLETTPGAKRVEVYATREDTENMVESAIEPGKMEATTEMYIPAKFNSASELSEDVTEAGPNSFDFTLE